MESIIFFICEHCLHAHLIIFGLLMLAGLNIPISEDVLLIIGGMLASTVLNDQIFHLYFWILAGCYLSAWEAYWLGRLLGPRLLKIRWFQKTIPPERMVKINRFYHRHGLLTLVIGRFIPFGVRNGLFMTAGISKMPFLSFLWKDAIACLFSTAVIFSLAYSFGKNYQLLIKILYQYQLLLAATIALSLGIFLFIRHRHKFIARKSQATYTPE